MPDPRQIAKIAGALARPGRFCGVHFFHPVRRRPLVEIVRGPRTDEATIASAVCYALAIERMPLVVGDGPGFLVNRLLVPYLGDALALALEGVPIDAIERAAREFGMAMGPMTMADEIGLDTVLNSGWVLAGILPDRIAPSPLLVRLVKLGRLGCKAGAGFFSYEKAPDGAIVKRPDPAVDAIIARFAPHPKPLDGETITARLMLPMLLEATRILEEGQVDDPRHIDLGAVFGLGFPAARGGLLRWADTLGPAKILDTLRSLEPLGPRMQPTEILLQMARNGTRCYDRT